MPRPAGPGAGAGGRPWRKGLSARSSGTDSRTDQSGRGVVPVEATFTAIGRLPKHRPDLMRPMLLHNLEEVDHSEMALADYVKLGGEESWARSRRRTPASFAVAATCRMLAEWESPFAYLGYMYL